MDSKRCQIGCEVVQFPFTRQHNDDRTGALAGAARKVFAEVQQAAYDDFCRRVDADEDTAIDPYAAEHIDEFFAVSCEVFFAEPELLREEYPAYYEQLQSWFRVDPIAGCLIAG